MSLLRAIFARPIYGSSGQLTVEVDAVLQDGSFGRTSLPASALKKGGSPANPTPVPLTLESFQAVGRLVNETITAGLVDWDALDQAGLDQRLGDLVQNSQLGTIRSAVTLAISVSVARAAARYTGQTFWRYLGGGHANLLPVPWFHLTESSLTSRRGRGHLPRGADRESSSAPPASAMAGLTILALPVGMPNYQDALRCGCALYQQLEQALSGTPTSGLLGPHGGHVVTGMPLERILELVLRTIERAGFRPGQEVMLAFDMEADRRFEPENATYRVDGEQIDAATWLTNLTAYVQKYPIAALIDSSRADDAAAGQLVTARLGTRVQLVRDRLFEAERTDRSDSTSQLAAASAALGNTQRLSCVGLGSLTEAFRISHQADAYGQRLLLCPGQGETEDPLIAELSVIFRTGQLLAGAPCRSDSLAKYNQLLRLAEELGRNALYAGRGCLQRG
jgi:enolase